MKNILDAIPADSADEIFESLIDNGSVRIERIISRGHASPESGWYDQQQNEWIMVIRGEANLVFDDGNSVNMREGDYLNIPAHCKHRVEWTAPDIETIWLVVHYQQDR